MHHRTVAPLLESGDFDPKMAGGAEGNHFLLSDIAHDSLVVLPFGGFDFTGDAGDADKIITLLHMDFRIAVGG